ncbi:hypothetical protein J6500_26935 [Bradyrhizobium sp. WSM 1704]|uniref:hypothetical protein n=1 Tax=Bradyrhizobium semiaridum TaxID=2821404 RepID=UPI001CE2807E|nr:hypothetical protein [Bradyrhizobium semiaridum]MCA6125504.1 hypothetical protein [Bradyrhizobium semiaridum]
MRTILILLAIWLLLNVLFVLIVMPPLRPRKSGGNPSDGTLAPAPIDKGSYAYEAEEQPSLRHIIVSVAMGTFFVLVPPLLEALSALKRLFGKDSGKSSSQNGG